MAKIRVLLAVNEDIALAGLTAILKSGRETEICGKASSAEEACSLAEKSKPDVILFASELNGLTLQQVMNKLNVCKKKPMVVVMGHTSDISQVNLALKAGCSGYMLYSTGKDELLGSLQNILDGDRIFSDEVLKLISDKYAQLAQASTGDQPVSPITRRERDVLRLVIDGYTSLEIAKLLYISPRTVETHRANLMSKLKIKNTAGLIRYALEEGEV